MNNNDLFNENIGYANKIASCFFKKYHSFIEYDDLNQLCLIGLFNASNTYDKSKSTFKTYAFNCIRNNVFREFKKTKKQVKCIDNNEFYENLLELESQKSFNIELNSMSNIKDLEYILTIVEKYDSLKKDILKEFIFNESNQNEIAKKFNVSRSYIFQVINNFRNKIRKGNLI